MYAKTILLLNYKLMAVPILPMINKHPSRPEELRLSGRDALAYKCRLCDAVRGIFLLSYICTCQSCSLSYHHVALIFSER